MEANDRTVMARVAAVRRSSLWLPAVLAVSVVVTLGIGYHYADLTHHRSRRPPPTPPSSGAVVAPPGTVRLVGTLGSYTQRVMSLQTTDGPFGVVLGTGTIEMRQCGAFPTLRAGERLEVWVPAHGNGILVASIVRALTPASGCVSTLPHHG